MKILHITDFHIDLPNGENENLREGYYEEFIDGLFVAIKDAGIEPIDFIVNTGDFVNIGKTENYSHAKKIMDYVIHKANIGTGSVAVTIGNHDFKMKEPGTLLEKQQAFKAFSQNYIPGTLLGSIPRAELYNNDMNNVQVLIIDNASREDDVNQPVPCTVVEQDEICQLVRKNRNGQNIIVISHYPVVQFPMAKYATEEVNWATNHVWKAGFTIQERISSMWQSGNVLFLCGDGHIPDAFKSENATFIMTGMLGGKYTKRSFGDKPFFGQTQARIYDTDNGNQVYTFNYIPRGFEYEMSGGLWKIEVSDLREVVEHKKVSGNRTNFRTGILSEQVQSSIIERIKREKLYKLGRYVTSNNFTALSWVSINRLFEDQQLLVSIIDKTIEHLSNILVNKSKSLIIGIDFHGSIIASHVAVRIGVRAESLNGRSNEIMDVKTIFQYLGSHEVKDIVFITDVVASGSTILSLVDKIEESQGSTKSSSYQYHCVSVISDLLIERTEFDSKITTIRTACGSLQMPIVKNEQLPNTDILSCRIDFTSQS